ncbi:Rieske (2Fe-2S) protein [Streptomyces sp. DH37]|uniref:Rieske (2Fe-2S) protein n=1 Tax=Streptomyces sp. DH37 TaxID=3040122 RepID=UPI0024436FA9|nr:Rieske (2Fe-2S) protein [Streptomyces sp. DH37]MDG9705266.1 Rieske (2Fe-2S) protein [Streptomyces sp. DH37]
MVFTGRKVVVTQPGAGRYEAFPAVCTHRGRPVTSVADGAVVCGCHDGRFDMADGSVKGGPATRPPAPTDITVEGGSVRPA